MLDNHGRYARDDSSASDDGGDSQSTVFMIGGGEFLNQTPVVTSQIQTPNNVVTVTSVPLVNSSSSSQSNNNIAAAAAAAAAVATNFNNFSNLTSAHSVSALTTPSILSERLVSFAPRETIRFNDVANNALSAFLLIFFSLSLHDKLICR